MDKKKIFKELMALLIVIGISFAVFVIIFFKISGDEPIARSVPENNPVTDTLSGGGNSGSGNSGSGNTVNNYPPYDASNLSSTYLVGFDYETADFLETAPSFRCRVRMDGQLEVEYWYELSNGETVTDTRLYTLDNFTEIREGVNLKTLYNLDPECPDPDEVYDGGYTYMYIYGKDESVLKSCGGFCPYNSSFRDMLNLLHESIPEEMKEDALYYKKIWKFHAENASLERYGVFLNYEEPLMDLSYDYDTIVIDAQEKSEADIAYFHDYYDSDKYVFSYINVGSLENFRDYYDDYADLALGVYENWEDEVWINVADERWQDFILNTLAPELIDKGIDGFFVDNCDVYYQYPTEEMLHGLSVIMEGLKDTGLLVIINGGDAFMDAYTDAGGDIKDIIDAINQETVLSCIYWDKGTFGRNNYEDREYFEAYLEKYASLGAKIYLLEYTDGSSIDIDIRNFCWEHDYGYYISDSIDLN